MVDDEPEEGNSTVMQRVNISAGSSSLRLEQNPQAKLKASVEISRSLGRALALDDVLPKVLDSLMTIFPSGDRGVIVLRDGQSGKLIPRALKHRRPELVDTVRISRTIVRGVMARQGGDPLGRRGVGQAFRGIGEHRRFPHPLGDVRAAGHQPGRRFGRDPDRYGRPAEPFHARRPGSAGERRLPGGHRHGERRAARDGRPRPATQPRAGGRPRRAAGLPAAIAAADRGIRVLRLLRAGHRAGRRLLRLYSPCRASGWRSSWPTYRARGFRPRS